MDIENLFTENYLDAFNEGHAAQLVLKRNPHIGFLLNAERATYYVQILYRLLCFRREHELEPLNEDVYHAIKQAQEKLHDTDYTPDNFNQDMNQLTEWNLLSRRIEKERLRGYKDVSRRKFRYRLAEDAVYFLNWLEERLQEDLEENSEDTRNLLVDVCSRLKEIKKTLDKFDIKKSQGEKLNIAARSIVYQIHQLNDLTFNINSRLGELNSRLLGFLLSNYRIEEARQVINELQYYMNSYLTQLDQLREEIVPAIDTVLEEENIAKIDLFAELIEKERLTMPQLLRRNRQIVNPKTILKNLKTFYKQNGQVDNLRRRIGESSIKVWGKLSAHLRELERKNNRLEDLRARIQDISTMPEDEVPIEFFMKLLAPSQMVADSHYWDDFEKALPPMPRKDIERRQKNIIDYLRGKKKVKGRIRSLEETRLDELKKWVKAIFPKLPTSISKGKYTEFNDFYRIIEMAKDGLFNKGLKINKIGFKLKFASDNTDTIEIGNASLSFKEIKISQQKTKK